MKDIHFEKITESENHNSARSIKSMLNGKEPGITGASIGSVATDAFLGLQLEMQGNSKEIAIYPSISSSGSLQASQLPMSKSSPMYMKTVKDV